MKKAVTTLILGITLLWPLGVDARRGCCSWHGGVAGCDSYSGKYRCMDGTLSPSCYCEDGSSSNYSGESKGGSTYYQAPQYVYGCTEPDAINYNAKATKDDGSCIAKKEGCTDSNAINYDETVNTDNNTCQYQKVIVEKAKIKYKKVYQKNNEVVEGTEKIVKKGINGEKEVTYDAIVDKDGNVISKKVKEEKVITNPVDEIVEQGTKTSNSGIIAILYIISVITVIVNRRYNSQNNLLINKVASEPQVEKTLLYIFYFIFLIPVFIDVILIIINKLKKK